MATRYWICPKSHKFSVKKGDKEIKKDDVKGKVCPKCQRLMPSDSRKWQGRVGDKITWHRTQREALDWEEENGKGKRPADRIKLEDGEAMIDLQMAKEVYVSYLEGTLAKRQGESQRSKEARRRSIALYLDRFRGIERSKILTQKYIQEYTVNDIAYFVTECFADFGFSNNTIRSTLSVLSQVINRLCADTTLRKSPLLYEAALRIKQGIKEAKPKKVVNKVFLESPMQIQLLIQECYRSRYLYHFTLAAVSTGLRRREITELRLNELDLVNNRYETIGKGGYRVAGPISSMWRRYIDWWLEQGYASPDKWEGRLMPYFSTNRLRKTQHYSCYKYLGTAFKSACLRAAKKAVILGHPEWVETYVKLSPHKLRHTFMSMMSEHATTEDLMEMVGQVTESVHFGYRHAKEARQRASAENLVEAMGLTLQFPEEKPHLRLVKK